MILDTKHTKPPHDTDGALLVDIDLTILGQSWERFEEYERQIRQEYEWVEAKTFAEGRSAMLKSFLKRPCIYYTNHFGDKYEARARMNLERSITRLTAGFEA